MRLVHTFLPIGISDLEFFQTETVEFVFCFIFHFGKVAL